MKNMIGLAAVVGFTLLMGWLIWGLGGRPGDIAGGFLAGAICVTLLGMTVAKKGKIDVI